MRSLSCLVICNYPIDLIKNNSKERLKYTMKKLIAKVTCLIFTLVLIINLTGCSFLENLWNDIKKELDQDYLPEIEAGVGNLTNGDIQVIGDSEFSIHFLEVGNKYTGDCTYIKAGDNDKVTICIGENEITLNRKDVSKVKLIYNFGG